MNMALGAGACASAYTTYRAAYVARMNATSGMSPVQITGSYSVTGNQLTVNAVYRLVDAPAIASVQATFFIIEDHVNYGGTPDYRHIARAINNQALTLSDVGVDVPITVPMTLDPSWNTENIQVVAIVQKTTSTKEIIQAAELPLLMDFVVATPFRVISVPEGSGDAIFPATVTNTSVVADVLTLDLDNTFGWPAAFQVAGDPNWYTSGHPVSLASGASIDVSVKITTDAVKAIGAGALKCQSTVTSRLETVPLKVFNLSPAILFVDDDGTQTHEASFAAGLGDLGYLYDNWDVANGHAGASPSLAGMRGFDAIIWQTGTLYSGELLDSQERSRLATYLDEGGRLYLNSPALMTNVPPPNTFVVNYLGVASRTNYTMANTAVGIAGDAISDGMSLPLTFTPGENQTCRIDPTATANVVFNSQTGNPIALRKLLNDGGKTVFSTILQDAYPQTGDDPNNSKAVLDHILAWLFDNTPPPSSVSDGFAVGTRLSVVPNPITRLADVRFSLSAAAASGAVRLTVVDVTGRQVRSLVEGRLTPGDHSVRWSGLDDGGRALPSGVYFARLQTTGGSGSQKFLLMR